MQNILLTGAAGFIGAATTEKLLDQGHSVIGVDNLNDYYPIELKQFRLDRLLKNPKFIFYKADIENETEINKIFAKHRPRAVLHLAARAGVRRSLQIPQDYFRTNSLGVINILEAMRKFKTAKLVLASTSSLYAGEDSPFVESHPSNTPISPYAASKKSAETLAYTYHHLYGIDVTVLRYFTVYGPAGRPDMATFRFIEWILGHKPLKLFGDGNQSRDFTYIDDVVDGTILGLKDLGYEIINIGCGKNPLPINNLFQLLEKLTGKKAKIQPGPNISADMRETQADITKAQRILGWEPAMTPEDGFKQTVQWHLENRVVYKKRMLFCIFINPANK